MKNGAATYYLKSLYLIENCDTYEYRSLIYQDLSLENDLLFEESLCETACILNHATLYVYTHEIHSRQIFLEINDRKAVAFRANSCAALQWKNMAHRQTSSIARTSISQGDFRNLWSRAPKVTKTV